MPGCCLVHEPQRCARISCALLDRTAISRRELPPFFVKLAAVATGSLALVLAPFELSLSASS
jgi:hypothetical protein